MNAIVVDNEIVLMTFDTRIDNCNGFKIDENS